MESAGVMKRVIYIIVVCMVFIQTGIPIILGDSIQLNQAEARNIINRSAAIIRTAQRFAAEGQKYDGLGLAVGHQLYAKKLYTQGDYPNGGYHSLRARKLAAQVITLNKSSIITEALYNRSEEKFVQSSPSGQELDRRLKEARNIISDQDAVNIDADLEV